ncbi:UNKNOWN [Stylonychia lemnae]|uniref:Uncharacterized protein n=1 Tax=Stylonychia lemnae TaxID=5949 RepID=A0A078A1G9_STYLE|nr:UNKNOWN [Stylonychia lemnae]|eukprot:CDW75687.1 UNKNOWN [Stylonychia lemnae]
MDKQKLKSMLNRTFHNKRSTSSNYSKSDFNLTMSLQKTYNNREEGKSEAIVDYNNNSQHNEIKEEVTEIENNQYSNNDEDNGYRRQQERNIHTSQGGNRKNASNSFGMTKLDNNLNENNQSTMDSTQNIFSRNNKRASVGSLLNQSYIKAASKTFSKDYAMNGTMNYDSNASIYPTYYNPVGPGQYFDSSSKLGNVTISNKFKNAPSFKFGKGKNFNHTEKAFQTSTSFSEMRSQSVTASEKKLDFLYPQLYNIAWQNELRYFQRSAINMKETPGVGEYTLSSIERPFSQASSFLRANSQTFPKEQRGEIKVYDTVYEREYSNKIGPGPCGYDTIYSSKYLSKNAKVSFSKAKRDQSSSMIKGPGPGYYENDVHQYKKSKISEAPKYIMPKAYKRFDIIKYGSFCDEIIQKGYF